MILLVEHDRDVGEVAHEGAARQRIDCHKMLLRNAEAELECFWLEY